MRTKTTTKHSKPKDNRVRPEAKSRTQPPNIYYLYLFGIISAIYLLTLSDRYFGMTGDGQAVFDTAVSLHEFGELGIGPAIDGNTGAITSIDRYSKYGLGYPVILQLPLIFVASVENIFGAGTSNILFPLTNLLIASATALVTALCLRDLGVNFVATVLAALGLAFATFTWPYISYDFSELLQALTLIVAYWLLVRAVRVGLRKPALIAASGAFLGFAVFTKAALVILIPAYGYYLWANMKRTLVNEKLPLAWFTAPLLSWFTIMAILNWYRFSSPWDFGYGSEAAQFTTPLWTGLYGLLLGPNKGLIFYAPLTLLLPWALWRRESKQYSIDRIFLLCVIAVQIIFMAKWWSWEGGASWGPRLLLPILPFIVSAVGLLLQSSKHALLPLLVCMVSGIGVNLLGVLLYFGAWGQIADLHSGRIPLDVEGRPEGEFVRQDGKKWFLPSISINYETRLSPLYAHAALIRSRFFDAPLPIHSLCQGQLSGSAPLNYPPIQIDITRLTDPVTISQLCSARFWLADFLYPWLGEPKRPALYGLSLELQCDRAVLQNNVERAINCYRRAMKLMPWVATPAVKLAGLWFELGKESDGERVLAGFVSANPTEVMGRMALARYYDVSGKTSAALTEYETVLNLPNNEQIRTIAVERIAALRR